MGASTNAHPDGMADEAVHAVFSAQAVFCFAKEEVQELIPPDIPATRDKSKKSRAAYVAQCAAGYFISILISDAYLAKLLSHLGLVRRNYYHASIF